MKNKVSAIWMKMAEIKSPGLTKRLYSGNLPYHLYCTYQYPEDQVGIALSYPNSINPVISSFDKLSELKVCLFKDTSFSDSNMIVVQLKDAESIGEFAYLCEKVVDEIKQQSDIKKAVKAFVNSLERWKKLFERKRTEGLSKEEQQGLYGELTYLGKLISRYDCSVAVPFWVGSNRALRDFQGKNWAVEVKTTVSNNPEALTINGERQLDDTMIDHLFLYHLSVEASNSTGESLPDKVATIREQLKDDLPTLNLLNNKLFEAGYFDLQDNLYKERCYKFRKERFYEVKDKFPRITESGTYGILDGVGDVHYKISIATCEEYEVSENKVLEIAKEND